MPNSRLKLTLVIPTYNEEKHIDACLRSVANQTVLPEEVIVVDNNSTDRTVEIVGKYDFVRLVHEPVQGLIAARNRGIEEATGEILGRIDADTILEPNWSERVREVFNEPSVVAVSGPGFMQASPLISHHTLFWSKSYHLGALSDFRFHVLWGANMAIRKKVWAEIETHLATDDADVHEDQDISLALNMLGHRVKYDNKLLVHVDAKRFWKVSKLLEYYWRIQKTILRWHRIRKLQNKPRLNEISWPKAWLFRLINFPVALLFLLVAGLYTVISWFSSVFQRKA